MPFLETKKRDTFGLYSCFYFQNSVEINLYTPIVAC